MRTWEVKVTKYKRQTRVTIPGELSRLTGLHRCEFVEMSMDSTGKIIMEAFDARGYRKVKSRSDQVGVN
jgi:bifunctional DNA-binding transcriptional regulator/antitoxin component of YhaV-PrlF toxin-antitoxin module